MSNAALMVQGTMPIADVVLLGMGIVFVGLICIVILCVLLGKVVRLLEKRVEQPAESVAPIGTAAPIAPAAPAAPAGEIPNRGELVAAIACCLAEEMGTDVSAIRIVSLKKV